MAALFWLSLFFVFYTYVGYPCTLWLLVRIRPQPVDKTVSTTHPLPAATIVIAAKNEESRVQARISNLAEQHYPGALEIILISDNSTDNTVARAEALADDLQHAGISLKVLQQSGERGKPSAVNRGVAAASGEILIFADARQTFQPGALQALAENFADPAVGGVSGELFFVDGEKEGLQVEMGAYWHYEKKIRKMESKTGSVMGATGAIYAIRRKLYKNLPAGTLLDDVLTPVNVLSAGKRIVFDDGAAACDVVSGNVQEEWLRKVRTLAGNWQLLGDENVLGKAVQHHFFFRFFWHKVARLLVPFFLPLLLLSSFFAGSNLTLFCGFGQLALYLLALSAWKAPLFCKNPVTKLCYFFCVLNWAAVVGFCVWLRGGAKDIWHKKA